MLATMDDLLSFEYHCQFAIQHRHLCCAEWRALYPPMRQAASFLAEPVVKVPLKFAVAPSVVKGMSVS